MPWLSATAALVLAAACQDVSVTTVPADRIEIDPPTAQVQIDQTVHFTARVLSETGQLLTGRSVQWTSLQPEVAVIEADGTARAMAPGTAVIRATSEGTSVDATVTVTGGPVPAIAVALQELAFSGVEDGATPGEKVVAVTNAGTGNLVGLSAAISYATGQPTGWLSASLSSTSAPTVLLVSANQGGLPPGAYTAIISVSAPGVANSPVAVTVSFAVSPKQQPAIGLSRTTVGFSANTGGANPLLQTVAVTNQGGGTLGGLSTTISYLQGTGWLTASLSGTTAPATLTLTATTSSLAAGTYNATVQVSSSQAANSPQQIQVSFTVASGPPGTPSNLTATPVSSSRIDLAWTASAGVVQQYRIQRRLAAAGAYALIDSVSGQTTAYQNTGLLPATGYIYRVEACAAAGCSGWSNEATATTGQQPVIGLDRISVGFSAVAGAANPPVQTVAVTNLGGGTLGGLSATISYVGQGTGWLAASLSGTTAPATLTLAAATGSLAPGVYSATVRVNSSQATNSPQQIQVSFTVASGPPGAPSNLTATPVSSSRIDLAWTASAGVVQQYRIQRKLAVGGAFALIDSVSGGTTAYQNTGLLAATGYVYRVEACAAAGCSGWSNEATATTSLLPVIGLSTTSVGFSALAGGANPPLQTVAVTNQGGGLLIGLSATISYPGEGGGWLTASLSSTTAPATLTLTTAIGSLVAGTYNATVQISSTLATNSPQQIQVSFTIDSGTPGAPSNLTATPVSFSRTDLAWTASAGVVQRYRIQRRLEAAGDYALIDSVSGGTTAYQNTGLLPATGYIYRVEACSVGCSEWSNEAGATTLLEPPGVPGAVTGTPVSSTEIQLSWTAPGGQTRYEIRRRIGSGQFTVVTTTVPGEETTYLDSGLTPSTAYQYQIKACADDVCSDYSQVVSVDTAN